MAEEVQPASAAGAVAVAEPPTEEVVKPFEQSTAAEQPKVDTPAGEPALEATEVEETEPNLEEAPETSGDFSKYKEVFSKHPELGADWRRILGREAAFTELGNFSDVKGIVERVPTLEDAENLATQAENHRQLGEIFRSDPVAFVESLKENDANAFNSLARHLPEILAQTDTQLYSEQARTYTNAVLDNLWAMAQQSNDQELLTAIQMVAGKGLGYRLGSQIQQRAAQPTSEVERLRKQLADKENSEREGQVTSFWDSANQSYFEAISNEIEADLKKALPNATEAQLTRMASEAWQSVNAKLEAQPQTMAQVKSYKDAALKGKTGVAEFKAIVDYSTRRARLVKPAVLKEVINEWSKSVIGNNQKVIETKKAIAATSKDAGAGVQATTSATAPATAAKRPNSREAIFKSIEAGTFQPRA